MVVTVEVMAARISLVYIVRSCVVLVDLAGGTLKARTTQPPIGALLREWRALRRMSQLDLALEADTSTRHLSCIETGKAQASRETIVRLADALGVPLRERNELLLAAGYAPEYAESTLATPELGRMRQAIELILQHQEPYPAFVISRRWDVLMANPAAVRVNQLLMNGKPSRHANLLHQVFDPEDFRPVIVNWAEVAERFIGELHREIAAAPTDQVVRRLLDEVLRYPGVPARWRVRNMERDPSPLFTLHFRSREGDLRFFETITTFAGPRDVALDEVRIECSFPADDRTAAICAKLAASA